MDGQVDDPRLSPRERAALRFASRFYRDHNDIDDQLWAELRDAFTPEEIIELAMSVSQYIGMGKLIAMLGIPNPLFRDDADGHPASSP
jgi:alkylhydroperoxidase family enzyme